MYNDYDECNSYIKMTKIRAIIWPYRAHTIITIFNFHPKLFRIVNVTLIILMYRPTFSCRYGKYRKSRYARPTRPPVCHLCAKTLILNVLFDSCYYIQSLQYDNLIYIKLCINCSRRTNNKSELLTCELL